MLAALLIVFREVIEAGLSVGIVLAATKGVPRRALWIGYGVVGGLLGACRGGLRDRNRRAVRRGGPRAVQRKRPAYRRRNADGTMSGWPATVAQWPNRRGSSEQRSLPDKSRLPHYRSSAAWLCSARVPRLSSSSTACSPLAARPRRALWLEGCLD